MICSAHFKTTDFSNKENRNRLKKSTVPVRNDVTMVLQNSSVCQQGLRLLKIRILARTYSNLSFKIPPSSLEISQPYTSKERLIPRSKWNVDAGTDMPDELHRKKTSRKLFSDTLDLVSKLKTIISDKKKSWKKINC